MKEKEKIRRSKPLVISIKSNLVPTWWSCLLVISRPGCNPHGKQLECYFSDLTSNSISNSLCRRQHRGAGRSRYPGIVILALSHTSAYVSIRQHTSAYVSIRKHASEFVSIRQHTSAHVSIRQHTSAYVTGAPLICIKFMDGLILHQIHVWITIKEVPIPYL